MDPGINYKRDFIILEEEEDTFRSDTQKTLTGYVKIEDRGIKAKISIYMQNIKEGNYIVFCICARDGKVEGVSCGNIVVDKPDKVDAVFETMSKNIFSSKYEIDDSVGICIVSTKKGKILEGFKSQKYQYILSQADIEKENPSNVSKKIQEAEVIDDTKEYKIEMDEEERSSKILIMENEYSKINNEEHHENNEDDYDEEHHENNEYDFNGEHDENNEYNHYEQHSEDNEHHCEEHIKDSRNYSEEHVDGDYDEHYDDKINEKFEEKKHEVDKEKHKTKKEELKDLIFEANPHIEDLGDIFIPFQNANPKAKWKKKHLNRIQNNYARRVLSIPYVYNMAALYGHYITGETEKYFIIGIPSRYNDTNRYMARYSDVAEWVRMSDTLRNYGYWMFVIDKEVGNIIYLE